MERRFVIALAALVLSLAALVAAGLYVAAAPAAPPTVDVSQQVLSDVALGPLAPAGMSGEFASRLLADAGPLKASCVSHPSDWSRLPTHGAGVGLRVVGARLA